MISWRLKIPMSSDASRQSLKAGGHSEKSPSSKQFRWSLTDRWCCWRGLDNGRGASHTPMDVSALQALLLSEIYLSSPHRLLRWRRFTCVCGTPKWHSYQAVLQLLCSGWDVSHASAQLQHLLSTLKSRQHYCPVQSNVLKLLGRQCPEVTVVTSFRIWCVAGCGGNYKVNAIDSSFYHKSFFHKRWYTLFFLIYATLFWFV